MKLTQTGVVFSRTTMVLFLCRNKSFSNGTKLCKDFLYNKREFLEPRITGEGNNPPARATPSRRAQVGCPHLMAPQTLKLMLYNPFSRKNQGERIIATPEMEPLLGPVLPWEGRSGVRLGLWRGGSSIFVITNLSPSPIPWCSPPGVSNYFVGSLVGEELDEIHHVIELVLLGPDP